jgi:hypothetical protein
LSSVCAKPAGRREEIPNPGRRSLTEIQDAVFRVEDRLAALRLVAGHHFGKADAEVHIESILQFERHTLRQLLS